MPARLSLPQHLNAGPLAVSGDLRRQIRKEFNPQAIFLNIPYGRRYKSFELALVATSLVYGLTPRISKERVRLEVRIGKINAMILSCGFGATDVSYSNRFNLPFELGLLLAHGKATFVIARDRAQKMRLSDLDFGDIHFHTGKPETLVGEYSNWLENNCNVPRRRIADVRKAYHRIRAVREKFGPQDFDRLNSAEILKCFEEFFDARPLPAASL